MIQDNFGFQVAQYAARVYFETVGLGNRQIRVSPIELPLSYIGEECLCQYLEYGLRIVIVIGLLDY